MPWNTIGATTAPSLTPQPRPAFTPSQYQQDIFDWIEFGSGNAVVEAVAGSGKSTTLVEAANLFGSEYQMLFCAFNKSIVNELTSMLPRNVLCKTINAIGHRALAKLWGKLNLDDSKYANLVREALGMISFPTLDKQTEARRCLNQIVSFAQSTLVDTASTEAMEQMVLQYNIDIPDDIPDAPAGAFFDLARLVLEQGITIAQTTQTISFNDQIWLPCVLGADPDPVEFVMVDECQDLSKAKLELVRRIKARRYLFVGDRRQCQPEGTLVQCVGEMKKIEDIVIGDRVVSYTPADVAFVQKGRRVTNVARRFYSGDLVCANTKFHESRYTPNHKCFVNFNPLRDKTAVYLMLKGRQFRIGIAKMDYACASGPIARARAEEADATWILDVFDDAMAARIKESVWSHRFGVPELLFIAPNRDEKTQQYLDSAWAEIGDNIENGINCLTSFGRMLEYPLWDSKTGYTSFKRPFVTQACNLISGAAMLPYSGEGHTNKRNWLPIDVYREPYSGYVCSLEVEKEQLYIADGLVTHNSIYGFAGANPASFQDIIDSMEAKVLPLSVCYRCPSSHIDAVKELVPQIEAREGAPEGILETIPHKEFYAHIQPGNLALCRFTAPLVRACIGLIKRRIPAHVVGRDIGEQLVKMAREALGTRPYDLLPEALEAYVARKREKLKKKEDTEGLIQGLEDKADGVMACYEAFRECHSIDALAWEINTIFNDSKQGVILSTVHRAKGLGNNAVYILLPEVLPFMWEGQAAWQYEQEENLQYVAFTRSKNALYFVESEDK